MENFYEIGDYLSDVLWEHFLEKYCERTINEKDQQEVTVNLYYIQPYSSNISFATFCQILKVYVSFQKEEVIVEFDRSFIVENKILDFSLDDCSPKYVTVFRFFFKNAIEVFYFKDKYDEMMQ